jgi:hypothetical protein
VVGHHHKDEVDRGVGQVDRIGLTVVALDVVETARRDARIERLARKAEVGGVVVHVHAPAGPDHVADNLAEVATPSEQIEHYHPWPHAEERQYLAGIVGRVALAVGLAASGDGECGIDLRGDPAGGGTGKCETQGEQNGKEA